MKGASSKRPGTGAAPRGARGAAVDMAPSLRGRRRALPSAVSGPGAPGRRGRIQSRVPLSRTRSRRYGHRTAQGRQEVGAWRRSWRPSRSSSTSPTHGSTPCGATPIRCSRGCSTSERAGTFQSRTERDVIVRTSLARLEQLDIGDQALTFGRIDRVADGRRRRGWSRRRRPGDRDLPHRAPGHPRTRPRATGGRLAGPGGRALLPGHRARSPGPGPAPPSRPPGPHGGQRRGRAVHQSRRGDRHRRGWRRGGRSPATPSGELIVGDLPIGGPAALLAALDRARSGRMTDIVSTIQAEQDEIIRSPLSGVLVVQGGPGTGKTAVALHRAAYLLYTHRFPLERQGVLVVGPNPLFLRYIEQVLPSLGETGVTLSTVSGLVPEIRVMENGPADVARLKGGVRMAKVVARAVRTRQRPLPEDIEVPYGALVLRLTARESRRIVEGRPAAPGHPQRPSPPGRAVGGPGAGRPGPPDPAAPRCRHPGSSPRSPATRTRPSSTTTSSTSRTSRARSDGCPSWPWRSTGCGPGSPPTSCSTTSTAPRR